MYSLEQWGTFLRASGPAFQRKLCVLPEEMSLGSSVTLIGGHGLQPKAGGESEATPEDSEWGSRRF